MLKAVRGLGWKSLNASPIAPLSSLHKTRGGLCVNILTRRGQFVCDEMPAR